MAPQKFIVGYDRSAGAQAAARWALDEAARTAARVELIYAWEWPTWTPAAPLVPGIAVWPDGETAQAIRDTLDNAVAAARESHPSVPVLARIVHASAALTLVDRSEHADLVVLGGQGHSGVAGLLGSVSTAVSAQAHCPVVVVRSETTTGPVVAGVDDTGTTALIKAAVLGGTAPSVHNCQPWRWRIGPDTLDLLLDRSRALAAADPSTRLAVLSCGAALHHATRADSRRMDGRHPPPRRERG